MDKMCNRCCETKLYADFAKNKSSPDGYSSICKKCKNIQKKSYRLEHQDKIKSYAKEYYLENQERLKEYSKSRYKSNESSSEEPE